MMTYKVAILGQDTYENVSKIKKHIFNWRENFYDKLEIVSGGGKYGVEKNVKDICLEFGIKYTSSVANTSDISALYLSILACNNLLIITPINYFHFLPILRVQ